MANTGIKPARNQSMECCKMVASILVVFWHVPFPGEIDGFVKCFSCFAVPVFFAISGYFNYGADQKTLSRRLKHLLKLYITAIGVTFLWGCIQTELRGGSTIAFLRQFLPKSEEIAAWFLFQLDPRLGQLWYLLSACLCYVFLRVYVGFFSEEKIDYRPLYTIAFSLFSVFFALGILAPVSGMDIPYLLYRNGWFMGLPMFTLGIFIHNYQDRILANFHLTGRKLVLLILAGILLSILQKKTMGMGQMTLGALVEMVALMLLLVSHPAVTTSAWGTRLVAKFGAWSTYIYLFHVTLLQVYSSYCQAPISAAIGSAEEFFRPFVVAAMSLLFAIVFERGEWLLKRISKRG